MSKRTRFLDLDPSVSDLARPIPGVAFVAPAPRSTLQTRAPPPCQTSPRMEGLLRVRRLHVSGMIRAVVHDQSSCALSFGLALVADLPPCRQRVVCFEDINHGCRRACSDLHPTDHDFACNSPNDAAKIHPHTTL